MGAFVRALPQIEPQQTKPRTLYYDERKLAALQAERDVRVEALRSLAELRRDAQDRWRYLRADVVKSSLLTQVHPDIDTWLPQRIQALGHRELDAARVPHELLRDCVATYERYLALDERWQADSKAITPFQQLIGACEKFAGVNGLKGLA